MTQTPSNIIVHIVEKDLLDAMISSNMNLEANAPILLEFRMNKCYQDQVILRFQ